MRGTGMYLSWLWLDCGMAKGSDQWRAATHLPLCLPCATVQPSAGARSDRPRRPAAGSQGEQGVMRLLRLLGPCPHGPSAFFASPGHLSATSATTAPPSLSRVPPWPCFD